MFHIIMNIPWILNIPGLYTWFWIQLSIIDIWQGSEYVSSFEYASFTQDSVENSLSYIFDRVLSIYRVFIMLYFRDSRYFQCLELWIKVLNVSGIKICYSYKGFWIKYFIVYIWQGSKYNMVSKCFKALDMLGFFKTLHYISLTGFQILFRFRIWQGSKHAKITQGSEQNAQL